MKCHPAGAGRDTEDDSSIQMLQFKLALDRPGLQTVRGSRDGPHPGSGLWKSRPASLLCLPPIRG